MEENAWLIVLILLPVCAAFVPYLFAGKEALKWAGRVLITATAMEFIFVACLFISSFPGGFWYRVEEFGGFGLSFAMDGFRAVYLLILSFMWMAASVFSVGYMRHHENVRRYYCFTMLTLGATAGVFFSADFFTTFLFFELMSFSSYVWVVQEETKEAIRAASTYLAVSVLGGMVMLAGMFLLYHLAGTLEFDKLKAACSAVENREGLFAAGCMMLFGFGAKAGMFPLHIWLPKAHPVAPAPASALLSGVLTKAGIFGIILLSGSVLYKEASFGWLVLILGTATMVTGAVLAVFSIDLKRTLACSSVSQVGFILVGLALMGLEGEDGLAVSGAFLHAVNHSMIKLVLFILAGVVFMNLHRLDLTSIRGFGRGKPFFFAAFVSAMLALSGMPPFSGYISKTLLHEALVETGARYFGDERMLLKAAEVLFLFSGGMTVAYMLKIFTVLFFDKAPKSGKNVKESDLAVPVKCLLGIPAALFLVMGMFPKQFMQPIAEHAASFFYGGSIETEESIHYFSLGNLAGAAISIGTGIILYFALVRPLLRKKEGEDILYINRLPAWFDLEEVIYRPFFVRFLPFLLAVVFRLADKLVSGISWILYRTLFAEKQTREHIYIGGRFTYAAGRMMDTFVLALNLTVRRKRPIEKSFVRMFAVGRRETTRTAKLVTKSVSYGLMLCGLGLVLTMIYLLVE